MPICGSYKGREPVYSYPTQNRIKKTLVFIALVVSEVTYLRRQMTLIFTADDVSLTHEVVSLEQLGPVTPRQPRKIDGQEFSSTSRTAEDRTRWKRILVKSSVVSNCFTRNFECVE